MKKITGIFLVAMIIATVLPSCKKYEDGPAFSLRSKKARLVNEWVIDKVLIDNVDVTIQNKSQYTEFVMNIKDGGDVEFSYKNNAGDPITWTSSWDFNSDKTGLVITTAGVSQTFDILKLKNDELWLKVSETTSGLTTITETHYVTK